MCTEQVSQLREKYPKGTRIELAKMAGEPQMKKGLKGTVVKVDDAGQIHVRWENGSHLALDVEADDFCICQTPEDVGDMHRGEDDSQAFAGTQAMGMEL